LLGTYGFEVFVNLTLILVFSTTGNHVYDFFMGRELNPRIGNFDLKVFCELRPGLIGWCVLNLGMAARQHSNLGYVTNSMVLVCAFQIYYVMDSFLAEVCTGEFSPW
jgi:hypothetical protein